MATRVGPYSDHPVWAAIEDVQGKVDYAISRHEEYKFDGLFLNRILNVVTAFETRISSTNSDFVFEEDLNEANGNITNIIRYVDDFLNNPLNDIIYKCKGDLAALTRITVRIYAPLTTREQNEFFEAAEEYRDLIRKAYLSSKDAVDSLQSRVSEIRRRLEEISDIARTESESIRSLGSQHQEQFSNAQESRNQAWDRILNQYRNEIAELVKDASEKIVNFEKSSSILFRDTENNSLMALKRQSELMSVSANDYLDALKSKKQEAEELLGVIGALGVTSGFQKAAHEAKITTRFWQGVSVFSMLFFVGLTFYQFVYHLDAVLTWEILAGRLFAALSAGVLATYAAQQASKYQKIESRNSKLALELAALGPFIAPLSENDRHEFIKKIGDASFNQRGGETDQGGEEVTTILSFLTNKIDKKHITQIIEIIRDVLKKSDSGGVSGKN